MFTLLTDYEKYGSCGTRFKCTNNKCVDTDLLCDTIDHCGDFSDESPFGGAQCGKIGEWCFTLYFTASMKIDVVDATFCRFINIKVAQCRGCGMMFPVYYQPLLTKGCSVLKHHPALKDSHFLS